MVAEDELNVAPLAGGVDRNPYEVRVLLGEKVAPLTGSVDRNDLEQLSNPNPNLYFYDPAPLLGRQK